MNRRRMLIRFFGFAGTVWFAGCDSGPASATVRGTVKLGGTPVAKGIISLAPLDNTGQPVTGDIVNGQYEIKTTAGKKQIQISVPVPGEKRKAYDGPDAPWVDIPMETVPAKYNAQSELTLDVQAGSNSKDWDLEAMPKKK